MSRNNRVCVDHRMRPTDPHKPTSALEGRQRVSTRVVRFGEYLCGDEKGPTLRDQVSQQCSICHPAALGSSEHQSLAYNWHHHVLFSSFRGVVPKHSQSCGLRRPGSRQPNGSCTFGTIPLSTCFGSLVLYETRRRQHSSFRPVCFEDSNRDTYDQVRQFDQRYCRIERRRFQISIPSPAFSPSSANQAF